MRIAYRVAAALALSALSSVSPAQSQSTPPVAGLGLVIATANETLAEAENTAEPGDYVRIDVIDNGTGMTDEVKSVLEGYGMTETSSVHTIGYAHRPIRLGSVGHPVPYSRVRIVKVDSQGQALEDCKVQEIGVVAMAGPGVFSGHLAGRIRPRDFPLTPRTKSRLMACPPIWHNAC